ncbi:MAG: hypothetical protein RMY28_033815 [Nostoc sp. ChiSLP01]|nr:hypothetical protein [Nostoc sp. CmiSLP01]MDZ8284616.1 hypothetical protein [Nostoc sp. ChiSLP01]
MNFPAQLQEKIQKWANSQGISTEEFVLQAVTEKINALTQQTLEATNIVSSNEAELYRKEGILVVGEKLPENFDLNTLIDDLREEGIGNQRGSYSPDAEFIDNDNPWKLFIESLDSFSDEYMSTRD